MKASLFAIIAVIGAAVIGVGVLFGQTIGGPTYLQAVTTGIVSLSMNQTAQLNVLNANPVAGTTGATATICAVEIEFRDSSYALLKQTAIANILPGASASLTLTRAEAGSLTTPRFGIRGIVRTNPVTVTTGGTTTPISLFSGCPVMPTLEVFDSTTGNTQFVTADTRSLNSILPLISVPAR
jgi:hypothetical protein